MKNHIQTILSIVIVMVSCQQGPKEGQNASTTSKDSAVNQDLKPSESGYADLDSLKMYYEVYGEGKPIVLLHWLFYEYTC